MGKHIKEIIATILVGVIAAIIIAYINGEINPSGPNQVPTKTHPTRPDRTSDGQVRPH